MRGPRMSASFGPGLTPFSRKVLIGLVVMFVVQLIAEQWLKLPLTVALGWWGTESGSFRLWQPATAYLLNGPSPIDALLDWLMVFFFLPTAEQSETRKGVGKLVLFTVVVSAILGLLANLSGAVTGGHPFFGLNPIITALIVVFGLSRPNASILLMFVLPIKAGWVAWGTGLFALLFFLLSRDLGSTVYLTGWIAGWLWMSAKPGGWLHKWKPKKKHARTSDRLRKFEVIDGGRGWNAPADDKTIH